MNATQFTAKLNESSEIFSLESRQEVDRETILEFLESQEDAGREVEITESAWKDSDINWDEDSRESRTVFILTPCNEQGYPQPLKEQCIVLG